jgi:DNA-binding NarL/FixJ family response regulator
MSEDDWLNIIGGTPPFREAIRVGFTTGRLTGSGPTVEELASSLGCSLTVVFVNRPEPFTSVAEEVRNPDAYVIAIIDQRDVNSYIDVIEAGADGVMHEDNSVQHLCSVAMAALRHDMLLPKPVVAHFVERLIPGGPSDISAVSHKILRCLKDGLTTNQIADQLFLSERTARRRIQNLYLNLGVTSASEALEKARSRGIRL